MEVKDRVVNANEQERRPDKDTKDECERPNPCSPEAVARDPCNCPKTPGSQNRPDRPKRPPPRRDECCEQLIALLGGIPGLEGRKPHKPKQRPERKVQALCDSLGIADAILPMLGVLWERHEAGEPGRNDFEEKVEHIFAGIDKEDAKSFSYAFEQYRKLRGGGKGECLFNDCLADAARNGSVERSWVAEELLGEGLKLAGKTVFRNSNGVMGPGQVRLWDNVVSRGPNGTGATIYEGPWPWLTAIAPDISSYEEYGNVESFRPVPGGFHVWQPYQYAQECEFAPDPSGKIVGTCARKHPPPPPPGTLVGDPCEGGRNYTHNNDCLQIPAQRPGGSIKLRGFNFITPTVKVRISLVGDPSVFREEECVVWGDQVIPLKDDADHFIVDERVSDWVDVPLPPAHPTIPGAPLPAGLYEIVVKVANVTNVIYDSGTPPILVSNKLLLRIEADPNLKYLLWSNRGRCNRETPGIGDDEIWWDAFVGHIVPTGPVPATGASGIEIKNLERRSFPREPWEDMDDGESAGTYSIDIFGPKAFELYGVVVIGMVGFEVDSESAARDQLQGFWNAWGEALSSVVGIAFGAGGIATGIAGLLVKVVGFAVALTIGLIALAVIAAITLIATAFWAAWAPADLIALDIMHFDASTAWDNTDPKKPLPGETTRAYEDPYNGEVAIGVTERALPKDHKKEEAAATWVQEVQYDTPEHGEDASYTLEFRLAR
jgi:hypothetical protein